MEAPPVITPTPLPGKPPSFSLPAIAWIAWGMFAVVIIGVATTRKEPLSPFESGRVIGAIVGGLLLPTLIAWITWRATSRSTAARTAAFLVALSLAAVGQISRATKKASAANALADFEQSTERFRHEQQGAIREGRAPDPGKSMQYLADAASSLRQQAASSTGGDRAVAEAGEAFTTRTATLARAYFDAVAQLKPDSFFEEAALADAASIAARREMVDGFAKANEALWDWQKEGRDAFMRELTARGVSGRRLDATLEGFDRSGGAKLAGIVKIRELDAKLAAAMNDFLDYVAAKRGANGLEARLASLERYQEIMARVTAIGEEQVGLQKQLADTK